MRANIEIDDDLMHAAMRAGSYATKKDAVEAGLRLLARAASYREILAWRGKLMWDDAAPPEASRLQQPAPPYGVRGQKKSAPMILVDSSVWSDFFRGTTTPATNQLAGLLEDASAPLGLTDLALLDVLRGFAHARDYLTARRLLAPLPVVTVDGEAIAVRATDYYRALRKLGITIGRPVDMLQGAHCIEAGYALLHSDGDFDALEAHCGLHFWRH
jgi:hypothetical protein